MVQYGESAVGDESSKPSQPEYRHSLASEAAFARIREKITADLKETSAVEKRRKIQDIEKQIFNQYNGDWIPQVGTVARQFVKPNEALRTRIIGYFNEITAHYYTVGKTDRLILERVVRPDLDNIETAVRSDDEITPENKKPFFDLIKITRRDVSEKIDHQNKITTKIKSVFKGFVPKATGVITGALTRSPLLGLAAYGFQKWRGFDPDVKGEKEPTPSQSAQQVLDRQANRLGKLDHHAIKTEKQVFDGMDDDDDDEDDSKFLARLKHGGSDNGQALWNGKSNSGSSVSSGVIETILQKQTAVLEAIHKTTSEQLTLTRKTLGINEAKKEEADFETSDTPASATLVGKEKNDEPSLFSKLIAFVFRIGAEIFPKLGTFLTGVQSFVAALAAPELLVGAAIGAAGVAVIAGLDALFNKYFPHTKTAKEIADANKRKLAKDEGNRTGRISHYGNMPLNAKIPAPKFPLPPKDYAAIANMTPSMVSSVAFKSPTPQLFFQMPKKMQTAEKVATPSPSATTDMYSKATFLDPIAKIESRGSGDYSAISSTQGAAGGMLGRYQMSAAALEDLGLIKKGATAKYGPERNRDIVDNPANWTDGNSKERFLSDHQMQDDAATRYAKINEGYLRARGVITPDMAPAEVAQIVAAGHNAGARNLAKHGMSFRDGNKKIQSGAYALAVAQQQAITASKLLPDSQVEGRKKVTSDLASWNAPKAAPATVIVNNNTSMSNMATASGGGRSKSSSITDPSPLIRMIIGMRP